MMTMKQKNEGLYTFFYQNKSIWMKLFLFIHYIGKKRLRNLLKHYKLNGIAPKRHGNIKRHPSHAVDISDIERALNFVKNSVEAHALVICLNLMTTV